MEAKFSPRVKDVISYSREEALRLGHDYIGTEHLLLGLIREGDGIAIKLIKSRGVDIVRLDRKGVVTGKSVSVGVDLGGRRIIIKLISLDIIQALYLYKH